MAFGSTRFSAIIDTSKGSCAVCAPMPYHPPQLAGMLIMSSHPGRVLGGLEMKTKTELTLKVDFPSPNRFHSLFTSSRSAVASLLRRFAGSDPFAEHEAHITNTGSFGPRECS